jgi:hypothetical protein
MIWTVGPCFCQSSASGVFVRNAGLIARSEGLYRFRSLMRQGAASPDPGAAPLSRDRGIGSREVFAPTPRAAQRGDDVFGFAQDEIYLRIFELSFPPIPPFPSIDPTYKCISPTYECSIALRLRRAALYRLREDDPSAYTGTNRCGRPTLAWRPPPRPRVARTNPKADD